MEDTEPLKLKEAGSIPAKRTTQRHYMTILYDLAEQAAEHAVVNPSDMLLESETDDNKVSIPKEFIDKFGESVAKSVFDWVVSNVGLMEDAEWDTLKSYLGIDE